MTDCNDCKYLIEKGSDYPCSECAGRKTHPKFEKKEVKEMDIINRFCYKTNPSLKLATDDNGNGSEAYLEMKIPTKREILKEDIKKMHFDIRGYFAEQFGGTKEDYTPISHKKYLKETEEE